jgi:hypothetical protein
MSWGLELAFMTPYLAKTKCLTLTQDLNQHTLAILPTQLTGNKENIQKGKRL